MFCSKCGAKGNKENQFCQECGNQLYAVKKNQGTPKQQESNDVLPPVSKEPEWMNTAKEAMNPSLQTANVEQKNQTTNLKNPRAPIIIAALLVIIVAILLVVDLPSGSGGGRTSGVREVGFDTPEEALIFYLEGLRDSDLEKMISAFALETLIENYNLEAQIERIGGAYGQFLEIRMPNSNDFITAMNLESRRGGVVSGIITQYFVLSEPFALSRPDFDKTLSYRIEDEREIGDFVGQLGDYLESPDLQSLEIIGVIMPEELSERYLAEENQANKELLVEVYGADEIVGRVMVFQIGRVQYLLFADLINYDGEWHILHLHGFSGHLVGIRGMHAGLLTAEYAEEYFGDIDSIADLIIPME